MFLPASSCDVHEDQQEIKKRLEDVANPHYSFGLSNPYFILPGCLDLQQCLARCFLPDCLDAKQCLARYLLLKLNFISQEFQIKTIDASSPIFWANNTDPSRTWGNDVFIQKGAGASGVCSTEWLGIPCAKKIFSGEEFKNYFFKEVGILTHLNHRHIVSFICCGNGQGRGERFIAMELMERSLLDLIEAQKDAALSLPVAIDIIEQIARGMCYLHDIGIAHRDLKPANVLVNTLTFPHVSDHFCVKLVDFGISKAEIKVSNAITMTGVGIGTTRYRAPEIHPKGHPKRKGKVNWFKADVYSFALTCAHVLSLKSPFNDMEGWELGKMEIYDALINGDLKPELPTDCPKELVALLTKCWHESPSERPSFSEICSELDKFRFKSLSGLSGLYQSVKDEKIELPSRNYIKSKLEESSSIHKREKKEKIQNKSLEVKTNDAIPVCRFDIHTACAENKDVVEVFFHPDPLHLLIQNYYVGDPDAICSFCEESLEADSEWVYRCELCKYDAHARCTQYSREIKHPTHPHPLTLVQCPARKSPFCKRLFCNGCKGDLKGYRYTCSEKSCAFVLHPFCAILPSKPPCLFDSSHRLSLDTQSRAFHCSKCASFGDSWLYHCDQCDMDIHVECVDDMEEEETDDWKIYDECLIEYCNEDDEAVR